MPPTSRGHAVPLVLASILCVAALLRAGVLVAAPFHDRAEVLGIRGFNDELSHINYVRYLAMHGRLPVQTASVTDADAFVRNEYEYYQPPLYYALAAPAYAAAERLAPGLGGYGARFISLVIGLFTVAAAYRVGSAFGPRIGLASAGLLAVSPVHAYFTGLATNDALAWLLGALLTASLLDRPTHRVYRGPGIPDHVRCPAGPLRLGLLLGLGLLAKSTLLTFLPLLFLRPGLESLRRLSPRPLLPALLASAIALALAMPYYARNLALYGSPLGLEAGHGTQIGFLQDPTGQKAYEFLAWTAVTFWSPFNWALGFHHDPAKVLIVGASLATFGATLLGWRRILRGSFPSPENALMVWSAAGCAAAGYLFYNLLYPQSDARLLFHAAAGFHALFALALAALLGRREPVPTARRRVLALGPGGPRRAFPGTPPVLEKAPSRLP